MISPIQLQHTLVDILHIVQPTVRQIFICNFDGSCLAHTVQSGSTQELALFANLSMLFDDCQEIGRLKLSQDEEGMLNQALVEVEDGIALLINFKGLFIVGIQADQRKPLGLIQQCGQIIVQKLEKETQHKLQQQ